MQLIAALEVIIAYAIARRHHDIKTTMQYYAQVSTQDSREGVERVRAAG